MLSPTWQVYMAHVQQKRLHPRALHAVQTTRIHTQTHTQNNKHILIRYYLHLRHKRRQMLQMCLLTWYWESLSATSQHYGQARTHTHTRTHSLTPHCWRALTSVSQIWLKLLAFNLMLSSLHWRRPDCHTFSVQSAKIIKWMSGVQHANIYLTSPLNQCVCVRVCACACNTPVGRTVVVCINRIKIDFTLFPPFFFHTLAFIFYPPPWSVIHQVYFSHFFFFFLFATHTHTHTHTHTLSMSQNPASSKFLLLPSLFSLHA